MARFTYSPGGYQENGEAGDHAASCPLCGQHFEASTTAAANAAANRCADNDQRGTDLYDERMS